MRLIRSKLDLIITDWRRWWKEVSCRIYELRILKPETEIMRQTPWSRIREQNSLNKELQEIVGNVKLTGSVLKETIAVSVTISTSVQIRHNRILLRDLLRGRMWEMHRETEVPEAEAQVEECFDCPGRITSKELATIHSVKKEASSRKLVLQDQEWLSVWGWMQIWRKVLLCASPGWWTTKQKVSKRMVTKVQWLCWKGMRSLKEQGDLFWTLVHQVHISGYGAAEVFVDPTEELKHMEPNPMCKVHQSRCTSRWHSRPKSIAWNDLPRWSSSA